MENNDKKITTIQSDLFQQLSNHEPDYLSDNAPDLDIEQEFMGAVKYALRTAKKHGLGRERIVERMNLCFPNEVLHITKRQLDSWCAESKEYHLFPAIYLDAFIWATRGIVSPMEVLTEALGMHLIDEHEQLAAELGKTAMAKAHAAKQERLLKRRLER